MAKNKWRTSSNEELNMSDMTEGHLQRAYNFSEQKYMFWTNRANVFNDKMTELEEEAERRGISLKSVDEMKDTIGPILKHRRSVKNK